MKMASPRTSSCTDATSSTLGIIYDRSTVDIITDAYGDQPGNLFHKDYRELLRSIRLMVASYPLILGEIILITICDEHFLKLASKFREPTLVFERSRTASEFPEVSA